MRSAPCTWEGRIKPYFFFRPWLTVAPEGSIRTGEADPDRCYRHHIAGERTWTRGRGRGRGRGEGGEKEPEIMYLLILWAELSPPHGGTILTTRQREIPVRREAHLGGRNGINCEAERLRGEKPARANLWAGQDAHAHKRRWSREGVAGSTTQDQAERKNGNMTRVVEGPGLGSYR
ncbi:hypothetical protein HPP92_025439 [Vanilla planifolia]|uniref:Uncharacterized protein n=1 Tax=Vanilla planifolia TaxID=51239 RepID=A0A835PJS9_VANPL|nr:hypothetical protein HPP92_025738 [Vanilla planifolia]KAG0454135.1 hypothetical protein HPP92_025439 [Vanilla planifolia]